MNYKDYYETLGVPKNAAEKDIKSAYRKLARKWHPDANLDNQKAAEERFKEIQEAYEVLGDAEKRRKYDTLGSDWERAAQQAEAQRQYRRQQARGGTQSFEFDTGGDSGFSDFFDMFFSGVGKRGAPRQPFKERGHDYESSVDLTLTEAFNGGKKTVSLQIEDTCPVCGGSGVSNGAICPRCGGTGRVVANKKFEITIPKGVRDGQRIRLAGQGGRGSSGGANGDLYLVAHLNDDNRFSRKGDDLYIDIPVSIYDLVLGASVTVPTMTGEVTMTIPPGTQNNQTMRLGGKGLPKASGGAGNQYVRLIAQLPLPLAPKERELYEQLAGLRKGAEQPA